MISVKNLIKRFSDHTALKGVSLKVARGEVKVIIGPSGCGKTTLLRCIGALEPFDAGKVRVGGLALAAADSASGAKTGHETRRQIRLRAGMVFQQFHLFPHLTVLQNIIEAPVQVLKEDPEKAVARARHLLEQVRLEKLADRTPRQLSGGEQQRVAIARALAMNPKCVLFDEPTSALDPEMVGEVLAVMRRLAEDGMTLLIATHEMDFARDVAREVFMLDRGRIIEHGPPAELFENPREERTRKFLARLQTR